MSRVPIAGNRVRFYINCPWCGKRRAPWIITQHLVRAHPDVWKWIHGLGIAAGYTAPSPASTGQPSGQLPPLVPIAPVAVEGTRSQECLDSVAHAPSETCDCGDHTT